MRRALLPLAVIGFAGVAAVWLLYAGWMVISCDYDCGDQGGRGGFLGALLLSVAVVPASTAMLRAGLRRRERRPSGLRLLRALLVAGAACNGVVVLALAAGALIDDSSEADAYAVLAVGAAIPLAALLVALSRLGAAGTSS